MAIYGNDNQEIERVKKPGWLKSHWVHIIAIISVCALLAIGIQYSVNALVNWHYNEFIAPFLK